MSSKCPCMLKTVMTFITFWPCGYGEAVNQPSSPQNLFVVVVLHLFWGAYHGLRDRSTQTSYFISAHCWYIVMEMIFSYQSSNYIFKDTLEFFIWTIICYANYCFVSFQSLCILLLFLPWAQAKTYGT